MPTITLNFSQDEKEFLLAIAQLENKPLADLIKSATFNHLEDYYEVHIGDKPYEDLLRYPKHRPLSDILGPWLTENHD